MDEHVEPEIGHRPPEWAQAFRIERLLWQLGCNHDTGKAKLDGTTLEFGNRALWVQRGDMRESDEAAGKVPFRLMHAVIDQSAGGKVRLIKPNTAGEHRNIDAGIVHHPHMPGKIGEQRIEAVIWVSIVVEANGRNNSS